MVSPNRLAEIATVIGEPARAAMLTALMDGRALTATELAHVAGITPQTASAHLARMLAADLLKVEQQGRHRYHRLAKPSVAGMLEGLMLHAADSDSARKAPRTGPRDDAMRTARTCYDHLAGRLGVAIADALVAQRYIALDDDLAMITPRGARFFEAQKLLARDDSGATRNKRPLCRACLDWSERRPHLAGRLGAAICTYAFEQGWIRRVAASRALTVTPKGRTALKDVFGIDRLI